ncbi:translocation/assembly module TamB domain-containing protein [Methylobacillus arboreus]|uniref:translocation/assembly module TamB domain-containing protein n=1 Tax=Methylobacillus arboreus TaxID=755170 RepID=UPI001E4904A1|nr:translocation/assembly module TamB domain-containing protein [Methylobacillus arboreus]MCB5189450.1 translocation/assembly module TamB domain-containing protein [Methylobacillus arboreus]
MAKRALLILLLWFLPCIAPAYALIQIDSSLQDLHYDAGNMEIDLLQFDSSLRLLPTREGRLRVDKLHAERLVITIKQAPEEEMPVEPASGLPDLPDTIQVPFPIEVEQASIDEIEIVSGNSRQVLRHVTLNMTADSKAIRLQLARAETPWGNITADILLQNSKPFPLAGNIHVQQAQGNMPYDLNTVLSGDLQALRFEMRNLFAMQDGLPALVPTDSPLPAAGRLDIQGELGLEGDLPLNISISLRDLDPKALGQAEDAKLSFDLGLNGKLMPTADLNLAFDSLDSQWRGQPLQAKASLHLLDNLLESIQIDATLGTNRITASGSLGRADSNLAWQAKLPTLNTFGSAFAGNAEASGTIAGQLDDLRAQFQLLAENLRLPGNLSARKVSGNGNLHTMGDLNAELNTEGLRINQGSFIDGKLSLSGNRAQHALRLQASGTGLKLQSTLSGGFDAAGGWSGALQELSYQAGAPITLQAPAPISYDSINGLSVETLALQFKQGRITLDSLRQGPQGLFTHGRIEQLALQDIPPLLFTLPANLKGNPVFSGQWDIRAEDTLNGTFTLQRESGDLAVVREGEADQPLGLSEIKLQATIRENQVDLAATIHGNKLGNIEAHASTRLTGEAGSFSLAGDAPLQARLTADIGSLSWLPTPDIQADGRLNIAINASGSVGQPVFDGHIRGRDLAVALPAEGVKLTNGQLDASLAGDRLTLDTLRFTGGKGSISASGGIRLAAGKPAMTIDWVLDNFTAAERTDRLLVLNGTAKTALQDNQLMVDGDLRVVRGLIELAGEGAPQLGDDVVVVGRERDEEESPLQFTIGRLRINLGDEVIGIVDPGKQFLLRGFGLDGYLTGILTLSGTVPNSLRAEGSIVVGGTYMAYGQLLNITKGIVNFSGPVDNPGLNIIAMRQNQTVQAGVEITGNVQMPTVKLVSNPSVPDSEKLSWLVLGHGLDQAGKNEFAMLSLAAGVLLSQGQSVPLQTRMARAAGLDSFSIGGSDVESSTVNFGKRLSSKLYLSYEKSLTGLLNVAKLTYTISQRWSVVSQAGSESAVDVLYTFRFK